MRLLHSFVAPGVLTSAGLLISAVSKLTNRFLLYASRNQSEYSMPKICEHFVNCNAINCSTSQRFGVCRNSISTPAWPFCLLENKGEIFKCDIDVPHVLESVGKQIELLEQIFLNLF